MTNKEKNILRFKEKYNKLVSTLKKNNISISITYDGIDYFDNKVLQYLKNNNIDFGSVKKREYNITTYNNKLSQISKAKWESFCQQINEFSKIYLIYIDYTVDFENHYVILKFDSPFNENQSIKNILWFNDIVDLGLEYFVLDLKKDSLFYFEIDDEFNCFKIR